MAVLSGATASGRVMYQGILTTTLTTIYTAPAASANVTSPSATAYIKEIIICNYTSSPATVTLQIGSSSTSILYGVTISANDTKVLSGLNTMLPAGAPLVAGSNTGSAIQLFISGVEIQ